MLIRGDDEIGIEDLSQTTLGITPGCTLRSSGQPTSTIGWRWHAVSGSPACCAAEGEGRERRDMHDAEQAGKGALKNVVAQ
jgi:hypothetical protein